MHIREVVKIENSRAILECGHGKPAQDLEQGQKTDCATCLFDPEARLKFDQAHVKKMRSPTASALGEVTFKNTPSQEIP